MFVLIPTYKYKCNEFVPDCSIVINLNQIMYWNFLQGGDYLQLWLSDNKTFIVDDEFIDLLPKGVVI